MMALSINQIAQQTGDTTANAAARIRRWEAAVGQAWRRWTYNHSGLPTANDLSLAASRYAGEHLGADYCRFVAGVRGYGLATP